MAARTKSNVNPKDKTRTRDVQLNPEGCPRPRGAAPGREPGGSHDEEQDERRRPRGIVTGS